MTYQPQPKSVGTTLILNFLIPGLGFFYLGKVGLGLFAFFLTLIVGAATAFIGGLAFWLFWLIMSVPATNSWNAKYIPGYAKSEKVQEVSESKDTRTIVQKRKDKRFHFIAVGIILLLIAIVWAIGHFVA